MSSRIASMSDDELWRLANSAAGTSSRAFDVSAIPEPLAAALTVELAQGIIDNGGIEYLLGPDLPVGVEYPDIVRSFKLIESWLCAEALDEVYRAFPGGVPPNSDAERTPALDALLSTKRDMLDQVSRTFWDSSESNYAAAIRLLRAHPEVFNAAA